MAKIFISYRRDDARYPAARLHAALKPHVNNPQTDIFIDVDNIPAGVDFIAHLEDRVAECDVLLAVIGPDWMDLRDPQTGARRLDNPNDLVRIEVATALKRDIPVVPVLLDGVGVPPSELLPEDLRALSRRNGIPVRHESFEHDVARLVERLPVVLKDAPQSTIKQKTKPRGATKAGAMPPLTIGLAAGGLALATLIFVWTGMSRDKAPSEPVESLGSTADAADGALSAVSTGVADAEEAYALGDKAYLNQEFDVAAIYLEAACTGGKARGCSDLGLMYERGFGVSVDTERARRLYTKGCDGADAFGCERLNDLDMGLAVQP